MIRKGFVMTIHPGREDEYKLRHSPIWPELEGILKSHGVHNYSIFLDTQNYRLFAYVEIEEEARWDALAQTECCRRWWQSIKDLMPSHEDGSPVSSPLQEIFHLD
jgi:L-rhamnose mutarotase